MGSSSVIAGMYARKMESEMINQQGGIIKNGNREKTSALCINMQIYRKTPDIGFAIQINT